MPFLPAAGLTMPRPVIVVSGMLATAACAVLLADGQGISVLVAVLGAGSVALAAKGIGLGRADSILGSLMVVSYPAHLLLLALFHVALVALGRGGFVTGDDYGYFDLSSRLADHLHGLDAPINWSAEAYLLNNYFVQFEAAVFYVLGPLVVVMKVLNVTMLHWVALLLYDISRRTFSRKTASLSAAVMLIFPSLTLWSILNLKDMLALVLVALVLWSAVRYEEPRSPWWLVTGVMSLIVLQGVRNYLFLLLALLLPVTIALRAESRAALRTRLRHLLPLTLICGALMAYTGSGFLGLGRLNIQTLAELESDRAWMGAGARTSIADAPRPLIAKAGDRFVVVAAGATNALSPGSATATPMPRVIVVQPFTQIELEGSAGATRAASREFSQVVIVRPNDVVVVAGASPSNASPMPLVLGGERQPNPEIRTDDSLSPSAVAVRTLWYLPIGLAYALFAPFPWATSVQERIALVDMAAWYVVLVAAAITLWRLRRNYRGVALPALYAIGVVVILSLIEGNVGTLFRHRAMAIPAIVVLAGPTLLRVLPARVSSLVRT